MNHSNRSKTGRFWHSTSGWLLGAWLVGVGCSQSQSQDITGETHFLRVCDVDADGCGAGLACTCGVCTRACEVSADCAAFPPADCVAAAAASAPQSCDGAAPPRHCDVTCGSDADCLDLSSGHHCELGFCRAGDAPPSEGGGELCTRGEVEGNRVVVLGDTFMALTHEVTAGIEELARAAGALPAGQRYRDESRSVNNALALGGAGILSQYERAAAEGGVDVVIMNGGGADALNGTCEAPPAASCQVFTAAVAAAEELFLRMAADGVAHVVYAFYPDPVNPEVRGKLDVLRPLLQAACDESHAPCHFLDLRPVFEGRYAEYITADGLDPTAAGSRATAAAIWATMQELCIAQ